MSQPESQEVSNDHSKTIAATRNEEKDQFPEALNQREVYTGQHLRYHPIELTALTEDELRKIRIKINNGREYEGFLDSLNTEKLQLKSLQDGGEVIRPFQLERITLLEVMM
ncbi:hypothetical protein [Endozoicomonas sp.]|uniref:hypothetical protein n=1 Tax=Endozoicomonas sp. TaxID=1892382 RepID=UPI00383BD108